jgi:hypothetical protein
MTVATKIEKQVNITLKMSDRSLKTDQKKPKR